jgi:phage gpG-like protein
VFGAVVTEALHTSIRRSTNLVPAFEAFQDTWIEQETAIFDEEGPGWEPLSDAYAAWKRSKVGDKPILEFSGRLRDSFTDPSSPDMIYVARPRTLQIGTAVPYSDVHQHGWRGVPAREHDVMWPETFGVLVGLVGDYIDQPLDEVLL